MTKLLADLVGADANLVELTVAVPHDRGDVQFHSFHVGLRPDDDSDCHVLAHHPHLEVVLRLQEFVHVFCIVEHIPEAQASLYMNFKYDPVCYHGCCLVCNHG